MKNRFFKKLIVAALAMTIPGFSNLAVAQETSSTFSKATFDNVMNVLHVSSGKIDYAAQDGSVASSRNVKSVAREIDQICRQPNSQIQVQRSYQDLDGKVQSFVCTEKSAEGIPLRTTQVILATDNSDRLADLQVIQLENSKETKQTLSSSIKEGARVVVGISAGTLAAGLLARQVYSNQTDKIKHALAGSLVAATSSLIAYYGFKVSEDQAMWIGIASAIIVGILKEVYDKYTPGRQVEFNDAVATSFGGLAALGFKWQRSF